MKTRPRGLRLPEHLAREVERERERSGKSWSRVVTELLEEAVRMRRVPGIVFRSGPTGRRAAVAGTGLDVWEIVAAYRTADESWEGLVEELSWIEPSRLRAALAYYELFPGEIDGRLEREEELTRERIHRRHPFTRPTGP